MPQQTIGGRYELEQPLGGSSMSSVWLAVDRELERKVAVKLLAPDADRARFEREAHAVASLSHPNIVQLFDYGEAEPGPFIVLEHMPAGTLEERLAGGRALPDDATMRIAQEIAAGLAHAHERGLVHRDLKPANILFDAEERAKVADFGIARIEGGNELTVAGTVLGTAAYLSPEQASGLPATPASDVYSFGVILFRMLTGRPPFVSGNAMELVRMHQEEQPPLVEELRSDAPPSLAALVAAALAKDPAERPRDGSALLAALTGMTDAPEPEEAAATQIMSAPLFDGSQTQVIPRARPPRRPRRAVPAAIAGGAVLALVGAAAAFILTTGESSGTTPTTAPIPSLPSVGRQTTAPRSTSTPTAPSTASSSTSSTSSTTSSTTSTRRTTTTPPLSTSSATAPLPTTAPTTTTPAPPPTTTPTTPPTTTAATPAAATTTVQ
jgi:serine/threonine-protein kinase